MYRISRLGLKGSWRQRRKSTFFMILNTAVNRRLQLPCAPCVVVLASEVLQKPRYDNHRNLVSLSMLKTERYSKLYKRLHEKTRPSYHAAQRRESENKPALLNSPFRGTSFIPRRY